MYTTTRVMSIKERNNSPGTALPKLELQPGVPDGFISVKLPRTNLDHQDPLVQRRIAGKSGGRLTVEWSYLWDLALLLGGCTSENEYSVDWDSLNLDVVRLSKSLVYLLRHSLDVKFDLEGFVSLSHLVNDENSPC